MPSRYTGTIMWAEQEVDRWFNLIVLDVLVGATSAGCMFFLIITFILNFIFKYYIIIYFAYLFLII